MSEQYQNYTAQLPYTYAFGHFTAETMLHGRPHLAQQLVLHPQIAPSWATRLHAAAKAAGTPVTTDEALITRLRKKASVHAVLVLRKETDVLGPVAPHVVLAGISQYGNFGTIMRTAVAFGFHDVALVASPLEEWNPHALRASVGLRAQLRVTSYPTLAQYRAAHPVHHPLLLAATHAQGLHETPRPTEPFSVVFGPEWPASTELANELADLPATRVRIAQAPAAESLNVASAAAIVLHQWRGL